MARVYAKARNNDPALPFNTRKMHFASGRGFAVDVRVRDWRGDSSSRYGDTALRYSEGAIIGFWESADEAEKIADDVNSGRRYGPTHEFHGKAYGAIVVPAWNGPDVPSVPMPWETRQGSADMVAAYQAAEVPLPRWLTRVLAELDGETVSEPESMDDEVPRGTPFDDDLYERVTLVIGPGDEIATLSSLKLNEIVSVDREGIDVATERSRRNGTGPQRVPAWMVMRAWTYLRQHGSLSQKMLLDELNVKRSAFVCALLAAFPDVDVDRVGRTVLRFSPPVRDRDIAE